MSASSSAAAVASRDAVRDLTPLPHPARPTPRRNARMVVIGVLLVCVGALASAWLWTSGRSGVEVLVLARDVPRGQIVTAQDLTTVALSSSAGLAVIPGDELEGFVGAAASRDLVRGMVADRGAFTREGLSSGRAQVGLALVDGALPARGLVIGEQVLVVGVDPTGDGGASAVHEAVVATTPVATGNGAWLVDVELAHSDAAEVAALAAAGRVALVVKGE